MAEHYETWLELTSAGQLGGQGDDHRSKLYLRKAFAKYLECGITRAKLASLAPKSVTTPWPWALPSASGACPH